MRMKKTYITLLSLVLLFAAAPFVANARSGTDDSATNTTSTEREVETEVEHGVTTVSQTTRAQELEAKKTELQAKLAEKKAEIKEKLEGKRAEICEQRSNRINTVVNNRSSALERHLTRFDEIKTKIAAFVDKKQLSSDQLTSLAAAMEAAGANAQAAVDAFQGTDFVCRQADATDPGGIVISSWASAKEAMRAYRDAIKAYAKEARALATAAAAASDDSSADQGTGDSTTGGAQ